MTGLLVRVGVDQAYGKWNAPIDPSNGRFLYSPIPESNHKQHPEMQTNYTAVSAALAASWPTITLPAALADQPTHLDPDFESLTYGDNGANRGRTLAKLVAGDFVVFYSSMRPALPTADRLIYGLIGILHVDEVMLASSVPPHRRNENAHTRRDPVDANGVIVRGTPALSGRFASAIRIGSYRAGAYRVLPELLQLWGDLSCKDGFIQRSAVPPSFRKPSMFLDWLSTQDPQLLRRNY